MDEFTLSRDSHFVLYGAASFGSVLYQSMTAQGVIIDGYIDQRAEEIHQLMDVPVYALADIGKHLDVTNVIVILSVKNVFEHTRIAAQLVEYGLYNLLYKPIEVLNGRGTVEERFIDKWYEKVIAGEFPNIREVIPSTRCVQLSLSDEQDYILLQEEGQVTVPVPLTCLFQKTDEHTNEEERNILCYFPHIQFFKYLQGDVAADSRYYIDYCREIASELASFKLTDAWERNIIRNRTEIYDKMNQAYSFKRDFFVTGATDATWNGRGYFNIDNGQHRSAFMASKEIMFLPVRMHQADFEYWLHLDVANMLLDKLREYRIDQLPAPIEHPKFYGYPCSSTLFFHQFIFKLMEILCKEYYQSPLDNYLQCKNIYLSLNDWGMMSRFFRRCGALVEVDKSIDDGWNILLDDLFYMPYRGGQSVSESYDVGIWHIDCGEQIEDGGYMIAKHCFYIISENTMDMKQWKNYMIHCGIVGQEKMCIIYQKR